MGGRPHHHLEETLDRIAFRTADAVDEEFAGRHVEPHRADSGPVLTPIVLLLHQEEESSRAPERVPELARVPVEGFEEADDREAALVRYPVAHDVWTLVDPPAKRWPSTHRPGKHGNMHTMSQEITEPDPSGDRSPLDAGLMTWAALLARWTDLVHAGEGWRRLHPEDSDAERWRSSIPEIISLQSITFALAELTRIPVEDRSIARDRADLGVGNAAQRLDEIWRGIEMPEGLLEIAEDARRSVDQAVYAGLRWILWSGPDRLRMPAIDLGSDPELGRGTLALVQPGTIVLPGSPIGWFTERSTPAVLDEIGASHVPGPPVQVYRALDDRGRIDHDLVAPLSSLPAGLPLLVPISLDGTRIGDWLVGFETWADANDRAFEGVAAPDLRFEPGSEPET